MIHASNQVDGTHDIPADLNPMNCSEKASWTSLGTLIHGFLNLKQYDGSSGGN
jgi:hypothetical protein